MSKTVGARSVTLRQVAIPTEHGGWSLTIELGVLGLIVAPGLAGLALAGAALVAFVLRRRLPVWPPSSWSPGSPPSPSG